MHFCTDCGTPLPDNNTICPRCGKKAAAPESKPVTPAPDNQPPAKNRPRPRHLRMQNHPAQVNPAHQGKEDGDTR